MKNILMIATGGTIASKEGDLGLTPAVTGEELAASVPGIKDICHLEILQLMNIDSTNMRPRQWLMIRDAIMENYNNYDGFVVLHGTDTMAYTAAALSYLIQDSVKPIVLTGSQNQWPILIPMQRSICSRVFCMLPTIFPAMSALYLTEKLLPEPADVSSAPEVLMPLTV